MKKLLIVMIAMITISAVGCGKKEELSATTNEETTEVVEDSIEKETKEETPKEEISKEEEVIETIAPKVEENKDEEQPKAEEPVVSTPPVEETKPVVPTPPAEEPVAATPPVEEPTAVKQQSVRMTPYPEAYTFMPDNYDREAILNWFRGIDLKTQGELFVDWLDAINLSAMGNNTLIACVEFCIDKGYNPWGSTACDTTNVGTALLRAQNYDNTSDISSIDNVPGLYVDTFDESIEFCYENEEACVANGIIEENPLIREKVPQDIADACHQGK